MFADAYLSWLYQRTHPLNIVSSLPFMHSRFLSQDPKNTCLAVTPCELFWDPPHGAVDTGPVNRSVTQRRIAVIFHFFYFLFFRSPVPSSGQTALNFFLVL